MITAIVLLTVERDRVNAIAEELAKIDKITEVYSVAGRYDLAAILRHKDMEELASLVTDNLLKIKGILKSETLIAFRTYSRYDLERTFSLGVDN